MLIFFTERNRHIYKNEQADAFLSHLRGIFLWRTAVYLYYCSSGTLQSTRSSRLLFMPIWKTIRNESRDNFHWTEPGRFDKIFSFPSFLLRDSDTSRITGWKLNVSETGWFLYTRGGLSVFVSCYDQFYVFGRLLNW